MFDYGKKFDSLVEIVRQLRSAANGCPWDKEQTPDSLKRYLHEETLEAIEAIDSKDYQHIKDELGDILFIIILLSQVHDENDHFNMGDVIDSITEKMIRRHPHVFSDEKIETVAEQRRKWLEIKEKEVTAGKISKKN